MPDVVGLTTDEKTRVGRALDDFEHRAPEPRNQPTGTSVPSPEFWAELTGEGTAGHYAWKLKYPKSPADGTYIDADPAVIVADYTAREMNLTGGLTGKVVKLAFIGYDATDKASYEFSGGATLPTGEFQWQGYTMVSANQAGWDDDRATAILEDG